MLSGEGIASSSSAMKTLGGMGTTPIQSCDSLCGTRKKDEDTSPGEGAFKPQERRPRGVELESQRLSVPHRLSHTGLATGLLPALRSIIFCTSTPDCPRLSVAER